MSDYRFPKIAATDNDLSTSFDLTPMVHDLARQALERVEEGAVDEVITFLAENGHLADVIRTAKAEAWAEGITASGINLDWQLHLLDHNPYKEHK